jgi:Tat protein secretion system quality control protein TatD with DNase activity
MREEEEEIDDDDEEEEMVDVVEWIGGEHTPRNTMIRAVRTNSKAAPELWTEYDEMVATWGVTPWLAEALQPELAAAREEAMNDPVPLAADSEVVDKDSTD